MSRGTQARPLTKLDDPAEQAEAWAVVCHRWQRNSAGKCGSTRDSSEPPRVIRSGAVALDVFEGVQFLGKPLLDLRGVRTGLGPGLSVLTVEFGPDQLVT